MNRNSNFKKVKIKQRRSCYSCNKLYEKGSKILTVNIYGFGRKWVCDEICLNELLKDCRYEKEWLSYDR